MSGDKYDVIAICSQEFILESICRNLSQWNFKSDFSVYPCKSVQENIIDATVDAVIYVDIDGMGIDEAEIIKGSPLSNIPWLILTKGCNSCNVMGLRDTLSLPSFCPIDISIEEISHTLALLCKGRKVLVDEFCEHGFDAQICAPPSDLREDQRRLLGYLSEGLPNKVIAKREGCDEALIKFKVRSLLTKLGVSNRTQAAVLAIAMGIAPKQISATLGSVHGPSVNK